MTNHTVCHSEKLASHTYRIWSSLSAAQIAAIAGVNAAVPLTAGLCIVTVGRHYAACDVIARIKQLAKGESDQCHSETTSRSSI